MKIIYDKFDKMKAIKISLKDYNKVIKSSYWKQRYSINKGEVSK